MFVHICRVCSGGNILVASNALMFCILMSVAEIQPPVFKTVGNWACIALIAFCENMMYLFWKVRQFSAIFLLLEYYSNQADTDNRLRYTLQLIFLKVEVSRTEEKKRMITATMSMMVVVMMVIMTCHSFSGAFERLLGVVSFSDAIFTPFLFLSLPLNCALPMHLFLCISIALFRCLVLLFQEPQLSPISAVIFAKIPEKPFLLPVVKQPYQDDALNIAAICALLCNWDLRSAITAYTSTAGACFPLWCYSMCVLH